ncbi:MAG: metallophosphoesterase family protein [Actinomycetota bacterium]
MQARRFPGLLPVLVLAVISVGCAPATGPDSRPAAAVLSQAPAATQAPQAKRSAAVVIAAAGDIACPGSPCDAERQTAGEIRRIDPDAVLALGDLQYPNGSFANFRASYDRTWGTFKRRTYPAPGNHEYETPGAAGYYRYFGKRVHPPLGYYSFDLGGWHLVALNANCDFVDCHRERRWLGRDLRRDGSLCQLAYWHQPRFSSGPHGSDPTYSGFWNTLYRFGADVVLNGHDHDYERFAKLAPDEHFSGGGIREFVAGTGGGSHYPFGPPVPGSQVRVADRSGVLRLRLSGTSYGWSFVDTSGKTRDSGSSACHR